MALSIHIPFRSYDSKYKAFRGADFVTPLTKIFQRVHKTYASVGQASYEEKPTKCSVCVLYDGKLAFAKNSRKGITFKQQVVEMSPLYAITLAMRLFDEMPREAEIVVFSNKAYGFSYSKMMKRPEIYKSHNRIAYREVEVFTLGVTQ